MRATFLGTAASEGYPDVFCACANCERARALGGPNLRKRSALLIDDDLLIDLGPDLMAAQMHGVSLAALRYCLQTHEHADHLDPSHFLSRSPSSGVAGAPHLDFYATRGALDGVLRALSGHGGADELAASGTSTALDVSLHAVVPFAQFAVGPYRVHSVRAAHDSRLTALLYVIARSGRTLFYATDTGPLPEETWAALRAAGHRFDVVALDHTFGLTERGGGHCNQAQFLAQVARMRAEGLLAEGARVFAHHIGHHSNPAHPELVAIAARHGYEIPYDGLTIAVRGNEQ